MGVLEFVGSTATHGTRHSTRPSTIRERRQQRRKPESQYFRETATSEKGKKEYSHVDNECVHGRESIKVPFCSSKRKQQVRCLRYGTFLDERRCFCFKKDFRPVDCEQGCQGTILRLEWGDRQTSYL